METEQFEVRNRWTNAVQFTAEVTCAPDATVAPQAAFQHPAYRADCPARARLARPTRLHRVRLRARLGLDRPCNRRSADKGTLGPFLEKYYPALHGTPPAEIKAILDAPDVFERDIVVYTYRGGEIIEQLCEEVGWPNVTHDGELQMDNKHSPDKREVIGWAKRSAFLGAKRMRKTIADQEKELARFRTYLAEHEADAAKLASDYPDAPMDRREWDDEE